LNLKASSTEFGTNIGNSTGLGGLQIEIGSRSPLEEEDAALLTASPFINSVRGGNGNTNGAGGNDHNHNRDSKKLLESISIADQSHESTGLNSFIDGNFGNIYNIKRTSEVLGRGSSCTVFKSVMLETLTVCAEKVVVVVDPQKRISIIRELTSLKTTCNQNEFCPYVVKLYDVIANPFDGTISVCLEFMDGGSLQDFMKTGGSTNETIIHGITFQLLSGLHFLHQHRIIHRDIKPSNALISSSGAVKLADFGLSRMLDNGQSLVESFVGTFNYMAPERMTGNSYSFLSDVWAFGMTVLAAALGRYPYTSVGNSNGYWQLLSAIQDTPTPLPSVPPYSQAFQNFIAKACAKDPVDRYATSELLRHPFITGSGANAHGQTNKSTKGSSGKQFLPSINMSGAAPSGTNSNITTHRISYHSEYTQLNTSRSVNSNKGDSNEPKGDATRNNTSSISTKNLGQNSSKSSSNKAQAMLNGSNGVFSKNTSNSNSNSSSKSSGKLVQRSGKIASGIAQDNTEDTDAGADNLLIDSHSPKNIETDSPCLRTATDDEAYQSGSNKRSPKRSGVTASTAISRTPRSQRNSFHAPSTNSGTGNEHTPTTYSNTNTPSTLHRKNPKNSVENTCESTDDETPTPRSKRTPSSRPKSNIGSSSNASNGSNTVSSSSASKLCPPHTSDERCSTLKSTKAAAGGTAKSGSRLLSRGSLDSILERSLGKKKTSTLSGVDIQATTSLSSKENGISSNSSTANLVAGAGIGASGSKNSSSSSVGVGFGLPVLELKKAGAQHDHHSPLLQHSLPNTTIKGEKRSSTTEQTESAKRTAPVRRQREARHIQAINQSQTAGQPKYHLALAERFGAGSALGASSSIENQTTPRQHHAHVKPVSSTVTSKQRSGKTSGVVGKVASENGQRNSDKSQLSPNRGRKLQEFIASFGSHSTSTKGNLLLEPAPGSGGQLSVETVSAVVKAWKLYILNLIENENKDMGSLDVHYGTRRGSFVGNAAMMRENFRRMSGVELSPERFGDKKALDDVRNSINGVKHGYSGSGDRDTGNASDKKTSNNARSAATIVADIAVVNQNNYHVNSYPSLVPGPLIGSDMTTADISLTSAADSHRFEGRKGSSDKNISILARMKSVFSNDRIHFLAKYLQCDEHVLRAGFLQVVEEIRDSVCAVSAMQRQRQEQPGHQQPPKQTEADKENSGSNKVSRVPSALIISMTDKEGAGGTMSSHLRDEENAALTSTKTTAFTTRTDSGSILTTVTTTTTTTTTQVSKRKPLSPGPCVVGESAVLSAPLSVPAYEDEEVHSYPSSVCYDEYANDIGTDASEDPLGYLVSTANQSPDYGGFSVDGSPVLLAAENVFQDDPAARTRAEAAVVTEDASVVFNSSVVKKTNSNPLDAGIEEIWDQLHSSFSQSSLVALEKTSTKSNTSARDLYDRQEKILDGDYSLDFELSSAFAGTNSLGVQVAACCNDAELNEYFNTAACVEDDDCVQENVDEAKSNYHSDYDQDFEPSEIYEEDDLINSLKQGIGHDRQGRIRGGKLTLGMGNGGGGDKDDYYSDTESVISTNSCHDHMNA
jgi:serine/threonine protein kinase